jgi:hypothetical protein
VTDVEAAARAARVRLRWERLIWGVDMLAYALLFVAGVWALIYTTDYMTETVKYESTIQLWGSLLIFGGLVAFLGRLFRNWAVEFVANVGAASGAAIYAIILVPSLFNSGTVVLFVMVIVAWLFALRRYAELKIQITQPGVGTFREKIKVVLGRRTENTVPRQRY